MARADYVNDVSMQHVLAALTTENRLVMEVALRTGLRVGDVLALRPQQVRKGRFTVQEQKTGKSRRVYLPDELRDRVLKCGNELYCFPHRLNGRKHRTRAAVWKDLKRAAEAFRLPQNVATHTARKNWAVRELEKRGGDVAAVQRELHHTDPAVTLLYVMADKLPQTGKRRKKNKCSEGKKDAIAD